MGKGLYTKNTISKGANICNFEGTIFHVNELDEYTNKYKRENDDQRFYHLVLAECEIDDGFFLVKKVVYLV